MNAAFGPGSSLPVCIGFPRPSTLVHPVWVSHLLLDLVSNYLPWLRPTSPSAYTQGFPKPTCVLGAAGRSMCSGAQSAPSAEGNEVRCLQLELPPEWRPLPSMSLGTGPCDKPHLCHLTVTAFPTASAFHRSTQNLFFCSLLTTVQICENRQQGQVIHFPPLAGTLMSSAWQCPSVHETVLSVPWAPSPAYWPGQEQSEWLPTCFYPARPWRETEFKHSFSLGHVEDFPRPCAPESHCGQHCHRPMMKLGSSSFSSSVPDVSSELLDGCSWE